MELIIYWGWGTGTNRQDTYPSRLQKLSIPVVLSSCKVNAGQYIAEVVRIKGGVISEINDQMHGQLDLLVTDICTIITTITICPLVGSLPD